MAALIASYFPSLAQAAAAGCRTDPIVKLTDGTTLKIDVAIALRARKVDSIEYTLHLPPGAEVEKIIYTGKLKNKEVMTVVNDAAPDTYGVDTIVYAQKSAEVTVTMSLKKVEVVNSGLTNELISLVLVP